ncbi:MAG TPA: zinc ribbon domain-containing protein [Candidatus Acidoferrales bacterium]|nr:zinc ribbon domain-containing protein [Candidatus Acidoferrales bacterium]
MAAGPIREEAQDESITELLGGIFQDTRRLYSQELLAAKLETKEEVNKAMKSALSFGAGATPDLDRADREAKNNSRSNCDCQQTRSAPAQGGSFMPTYEFRCQKCDKVFELTCSFSDLDRARRDGIKCATCGSQDVIQQIPVFQVQTSKKS